MTPPFRPSVAIATAQLSLMGRTGDSILQISRKLLTNAAETIKGHSVTALKLALT
jgi:hypothetical protein